MRLVEIAAPEKSAISKPYGSAIVRDDYVPEGVPVVRGTNLADWRFRDSDFVYIPEELADTMPGSRLQPGDLVFTHRGSVGQASMIPRSPRFSRYAVSTSQVKARLDAAKAFPEFYFYWFQSPRGRGSILEGVSTVGVPGLARPVETVKALPVPLPPLDEQRRIAGVLGALDDLIEADCRLIDALWGRAAAAHEAIAITAPEMTLGDHVQLLYGKALPARVRTHGPFPVVSSAGIVDSHTSALVEGPGVVVGRKGTVGSVTWVFEDYFPIDTAFYVKTDLPMLWAYFALLRAGLARMNTDSAVPGLNRDNALSRPLPMPDRDTLIGFEMQTGAYIAAIRELTDEVSELTRARDELLHLLMSGKVRVSEDLVLA